MSVNYNVTTINARLNAVISNIDAGPGVGQMRLLSPAPVQTVALIPLQKPSGTVFSGVLTFSGTPLTGAVLVSTNIVAADIEDSTGLVIVSGLTVGLSTASDILMSTTAVLAPNLISLTQGTITGV